MGRAARSTHDGPDDSRPGGISVALVLKARLDRECLAALLQARPGLRVVGEASSGMQAAPLCARERPAVAIVDTACLWPAGSCRTAELLVASPTTRVLALAAHDSAWCAVLNPRAGDAAAERDACGGMFDCLRIAVQEGAHGVLRRSCGASELVQAVRALARGRFWVGAEISLGDARELPLSDRERAVAWLVGQGRNNKEIAQSLAISGLTVKKHVSNILRKMKLQDRLQLGLCVARHPFLFSGDRAPLDGAEA